MSLTMIEEYDSYITKDVECDNSQFEVTNPKIGKYSCATFECMSQSGHDWVSLDTWEWNIDIVIGQIYISKEEFSFAPSLFASYTSKFWT